MNCHIAYLEDTDVRWPPDAYRDWVIAEAAEVLSQLRIPNVDHLSMYFHLLGEEPNSFGLAPGLARLRLNRGTGELIATFAVSKAEYDLAADNDARAALIAGGVLQVVEAAAQRFKIDCSLLLSQLERVKLEAAAGVASEGKGIS